jgi:RimJ/RimL family protein N-acetyltransferase
MKIDFRPLRFADTEQLHTLLTDPRVTKHMPLADLNVSLDWVASWKKSKSKQWPDETMGPWAVYLDDRFAGWAGVQPDDEDTVELAVVLHVWAWNHGSEVAGESLRRWKTFGDRKRIVIYLPDSRDIKSIARRLNLRLEQQAEFSGLLFHRLAITGSKLDH